MSNPMEMLGEVVKRESEKILGLVDATIVTLALTKPFVVKDFFVVDTSETAKVKISYLGDSFQTEFLSQVLGVRQAFSLSAWKKLTRSSPVKPMIAELGENHETDIGVVFDLMSRQPNGEKGVLLTNCYANIFYCKDTAGVLRTVYARWAGDGWCVYSDSVGDPNVWGGGTQVFSRNSVA